MNITIDVSNIKISTDRLVLRPWQESDLNDFYEYASVEGVGEMAGWNHHNSIDVSKTILDKFISDKNVLAIVYKENNKVIGSLGLHPSWVTENDIYGDLKAVEIGYVLSKDYWGKGFMPEAALAVIEYCFHHYPLDALTIGHFTSNNQSRRVIEKCGFKFVKQSEYYATQLDKTFDDMKYILLREDYTSAKIM